MKNYINGGLYGVRIMKLNYFKKSIFFLLTSLILFQCTRYSDDKSYLRIKNSSDYDLKVKIYSYYKDTTVNLASIIYNQRLIDGDTICYDSIYTSLKTSEGYTKGLIFFKNSVRLGALFISSLNEKNVYGNHLCYYTINKESAFIEYKITKEGKNLLNYNVKIFDYYNGNDSIIKDFIYSGSFTFFLPAGSEFYIFDQSILHDLKPKDVLHILSDNRRNNKGDPRWGFDVFYKENQIYNINIENAEKLSTYSYYDTKIDIGIKDSIELRIGGYNFNISNDSLIIHNVIAR